MADTCHSLSYMFFVWENTSLAVAREPHWLTGLSNYEFGETAQQ